MNEIIRKKNRKKSKNKRKPQGVMNTFYPNIQNKYGGYKKFNPYG